MAFSFSADGQRLFFDSDGLQWIEGSGANASLAIDRATNVNYLWLSPDTKTLLFRNEDASQLSRQGTYQADIP